MPFYPWENEETGELRQEWAPMAKAPKVGARKKFEGVWHARVFARPAVVADKEIRLTSRSQARWHPDAPRWDGEGRAQFESMREIREYVAKQDGTLSWDPDGGVPGRDWTPRPR
jgi:hypothetical protein